MLIGAFTFKHWGGDVPLPIDMVIKHSAKDI